LLLRVDIDKKLCLLARREPFECKYHDLGFRSTFQPRISVESMLAINDPSRFVRGFYFKPAENTNFQIVVSFLRSLVEINGISFKIDDNVGRKNAILVDILA